uniref:E3 ubiquitin-protein ligase listerin n=1 Tax=Photinus pyralis TaxID=7054 RepID=A0A1Y1KK52_PHOPY
MGGKHKQAQRTKNNARPSSSCRSAELLGTTVPQFVGFSAMKESTAMSGFSLATDDMDASIDPNFQLVLKKMSKKDATTKSKALQEFTELIKTSDIEAVIAVLPFWPRLYCVLATDTDHKVREGTHIAHHQVVLKSKRNLAPYLKQFAGPWFTSQYDTYAPAASAATKSFQDAFPKNKIKEAIAYCQEEILSYIGENLTIHTSSTLSNPKITSPEDAEAKYQRVLISSLHGYTLYLQQLCTDEIEKQEELNMKIISDSKFWKFAKNKVLPIKSAWYCVISSICQKSPTFLKKEYAHIVGAVFSDLDESEPIVVQSLWEAILSVLSTIEEWWQYVNIDKLVFPKLWKLLKEGGFGNAYVIFPNLLPLISHLPPSIDQNSTFSLFFENMFKGMKHQSSTRSRHESLAISTTYVECLQYVIMKNHSDIGFCEKLIRSHLFPVLEWSLTDPQASYKGFFNQISKMIQYWSKNSSSESFPHYIKYSQFFWNNLNSLCQGLLLNLEISYDKELLSQFSSRQIELLQSLKHIVAHKQLKVSFCANQSPENITGESHTMVSLLVDKSYMDLLNTVVYKTCASYVKFINEKHSKELIECLGSLVQDFDSEFFFRRLNAEFEGENVKENLVNVYWKLLHKWLSNESICSNSVVELIFLLFKYLSDESKMEVLNSFVLFQGTDCFGWCIAQSLSHPYNEDGTIQKWLHKDEVSHFLTSIMEKELNDTSTPELKLILKKAFMEKQNGDLYLSLPAISDIVMVLNKCLLRHEEYSATIDMCASFAAHISAILYSQNYKLQFGDDLLLAMFNLCCSSTLDPDIISVDTIWEVNTAWQDAITVLAQELSWVEFETLSSKCADVVTNAVFDDTSDYNINHMIKVIVNFIKCINGNPMRIWDILNLFLFRDFVQPWKRTLVNVCHSAEYAVGHLCAPFEPISFDSSFDESLISKYFIWMDLVADVLVTPTATLTEETDEEDDNVTTTVQTVFNSVCVSDILELLMEMLESLTIATMFTTHYACTRHSEIVSSRKNSMQLKLKTIFNNMDTQSVVQVENRIRENLIRNSGVSVNVLHLYLSKIVSKNLSEEYRKLLEECDDQLIRLHLTQAFAKYAKYEQVYDCSSDTERIIYLRTLMHLDQLEIPSAEIFKRIANINQESKSHFLYESNIANSITWSEVELIIECMRLFSKTLQNQPHGINSNQWDFMIVTFVTWTNNIANLKYKFRRLQIKSLIGALCELFVCVCEYVKSCDKESVKNEWTEVFAQEINKAFLGMWFYISGE